MPATDKFHDAVRTALQQDGWLITHDPLFLQVGGVNMFVDLGAEKLIAAQKDDRKIAVEVKSFLGQSQISEFHTALGQALSYRKALQLAEPDRFLYLAIPVDVYETFFRLEFTQEMIHEYQLKLLVYEAEKEEIVQWSE
ncbi:MAG: XisH family protein [Caldilineaceae bacterium]|nr:XisH family protein [Caldilineaceae bacterium]